jgi:hypothetical protein
MNELSEDDIVLVVKALDHYAAYLVATQRGDSRYKELAERLQRKTPEREEQQPAKKKRA